MYNYINNIYGIPSDLKKFKDNIDFTTYVIKETLICEENKKYFNVKITNIFTQDVFLDNGSDKIINTFYVKLTASYIYELFYEFRWDPVNNCYNYDIIE